MKFVLVATQMYYYNDNVYSKSIHCHLAVFIPKLKNTDRPIRSLQLILNLVSPNIDQHELKRSGVFRIKGVVPN